jgi:protein-S-isoprenylcysteine O-methyltransferase Ste14
MRVVDQVGGWAFRQRSWLPVPLALMLLLVRWRELDQPAVLPVGLTIVAGGLGIRLWAVRQIGTISRTRAGRLGPLITSGPYALVRNPLYVGNWLIWTGFAVASGLLWMVPVAWLIFFLQYSAIAAWEESRLRETYGADYEAYARDVPRWIPRLRRSRPRPSVTPFVWSEVTFSERGTLLAAAAMTALLLIKRG